MLGKLLGYEMKAYGRILVPMYIALIALAAILGVSFKFLPDRMTQSLLFALALILYILLLVAVVVVTAVLGINRYYSNMLGREGYLMFSLPVKTSTMMSAKTLAALIWTIFGTAVGGLAIMTTFVLGKFTSEDYAQVGKWMVELLKLAKPYAGHILAWVGIMILAVLVIIVRVYAAVAIGGQWGEHRLPASILAYVAFKVIEVIIANIVQAIEPLSNWIENLLWDSNVVTDTMTVTGIGSWRLQIFVLVIILIQLAVYWLLAWHFTDKKLNLA